MSVVSRRWAVPILCAALLWSGACGLPEELKSEAMALAAKVTDAQKHLAHQRQSYEQQAAAAGSKVPNIAKSLEQKQVASGFSTAEQKLSEASVKYERVMTLVREDKNAGAQDVRLGITFCTEALAEVQNVASVPLQTLTSWLQKFERAPAERQSAEQAAAAAQTLYRTQLGAGGTFTARLQAAQQKYPNKQRDLAARVQAIARDVAELQRDLTTVQQQASGIVQGKGDFDIAVFDDAVTGVHEYSRAVQEGIIELDGLLREVDESYELRVVRLERVSVFKVQEGTARWNECSDWDNEDYTEGSWQTVDWEQYRNAGVDTKIASNTPAFNCDYSETYINDKDIESTYFATTQEVVNGVAANPARAQVDEETWFDYYEAAQKMYELYPKVAAFNGAQSVAKDEDEAPAQVDVTTNLVVEQKALGQYEDEVDDSPGVVGQPSAGLVGNDEYGEWRCPAAQPQCGANDRLWFWYDFYLRMQLYDALFYHPTMYSYGWYAGPSGYHTWRHTNGYAAGLYDQSGRRTYASASNGTPRSGRTSVSVGSVRGVGPRTRVRGPHAGK